jgi:DNA adenine methylase
MNQHDDIKPIFPWFGGKSKVAHIVWERFGNTPNYVEPFAGSLAVLLRRPHDPGVETVNDLDGHICNFWRAAKHDPEQLASYADFPVNENELHARHAYCVSQTGALSRRLEGSPDYFDAKVAGYWLYGVCSWIAGGWCFGKGPWHVEKDSEGFDILTKKENAGQGIKRQLPHLGDAGLGINRKRPHLGDAGQAVLDQINFLSQRLRQVRVCCGDWKRVTGPALISRGWLTSVFLDPPYADTANRCSDIYAKDSFDVAHEVREWAIANGNNPKLRIALCGYESEHGMPENWECVAWNAGVGYRSQNGRNERIWFSPHCLKIRENRMLF